MVQAACAPGSGRKKASAILASAAPARVGPDQGLRPRAGPRWSTPPFPELQGKWSCSLWILVLVQGVGLPRESYGCVGAV